MEKLLRASELMELWDKTIEDCNHDCINCGMWLPKDNMCFHEWHRKWKAWNEAEHKRLGEILR